MPYSFSLHEMAYEEYIAAYKWYENQEEGLGDRFMFQIERKLTQISEHPKSYSTKKLNLREVKVDSFPFMIVYDYLEKENFIHVLAIYHCKRNPKNKYRRK